MIKKFFDYITIKPNYVVEYQSKTGAYNFVQSTESYLDKLVNEKEHIVIAYAASKSHPSTPVLVRVSMYGLRPHAISDNRIEFRSVSVERVNENGDQFISYVGKHDLYLYDKKEYAIIAGKEMQLAEKIVNFDINEYRETVQDYVDKAVTAFNESGITDKVRGIFTDLFNEQYKEAVKRNYNEVADRMKEGASRLIDELRKQTSDYTKNDDVNINKNCALYKQLTDDYAVMIKYRQEAKEGKFYSITIFNMRLGTNKLYYITKEMFADAYNVLVGDGDGRLKFNSIVDILGDLNQDDKCGCKCNVKVTENNEKSGVDKPKKDKPIQMVQFREQDVVKHEPRTNKRKFNVGDKVVVKRTGAHGTVIELISWQADSGKKLKYLVEFVKPSYRFAKEYYSHELDKAVNA